MAFTPNIRRRRPSTGSAYPENVVKIMAPTIDHAMTAMAAHFKRRHTHGKQPARNWVQAVKEIDAGSGYSTALAQVRAERTGANAAA
ncbi:hypothetical protein [Paraburkholderia sp. GAS32]|uniref:hypothetical protein n=1 Tax=Paraburkholderia sp. GAS32 TaxID=3035129 RepID=UPI003D1A63FD